MLYLTKISLLIIMMVSSAGLAWGITTEDLKLKALEGHALSQVKLGFHFSRGGQKNEKEAVYWMTMAARQEIPTACRYLGFAYLEGKGTARNAFLAEKWFIKGANKRDTLSMIGLADTLIILKKPIESVAWLKLAEELSEPQAKWRLEKVLPTLKEEEKRQVISTVDHLRATLSTSSGTPTPDKSRKKKKRLTLSNGDSYHGEIENNEPHGFGERVSKSGKIYQGAFKGGLEDGYGILFSQDGIITYQGLWRKGSPVNKLEVELDNKQIRPTP